MVSARCVVTLATVAGVLGLSLLLLASVGRRDVSIWDKLRQARPQLQSIFSGFSVSEVAAGSLMLPPSKVAAVPTVLVPGMGDSCYNPGFSQLTNYVATRTKTLAYCHGPGDDAVTDPVYSFTKTMDEQVEHFAKKVRSNVQLAAGFNAMGLSQGNLVIRAYIHRYNDPPVLNFISVHGPHAGVASIPRCDPGLHSVLREMCDLLDYLLGDFVYTPAIQSSIAQSNYFRDSFKIPGYLRGCAFLPDVLDRAPDLYGKRFVQLKHLALVMAERDTMIFPKESEIFGAFADRSYTTIVSAADQSWYEPLGLRILDQSNRLSVLTTQGDHLRFSLTELYSWIDRFFLA